MSHRVVVIAENTLGFERTKDLRAFSRSLATLLGEPVAFAWVRPRYLQAAQLGIEPAPGDDPIETLAPKTAATPMPSAPFLYHPSGRPDWGSMWQSFCELALFGGPPHRSEDDALQVATADGDPGVTAEPDSPTADALDAVEEIRRGIWETTGLYSELAGDPGWLAVQCSSPKMAAWLCACILLENVDARFDGSHLLVPARRSYRLENEVKSVITVLAKTHHYWLAHVMEQEAMERARR